MFESNFRSVSQVADLDVFQRLFKVQQDFKMAARVGSQVFSPFRALGFITNHIPLAVQPQGTENLVVTAIGSSFHVYNCAKLNLLFVGQLQEEDITCITTHGPMVITAAGKNIHSWKRGKLVKTFEGHDKDVYILFTFGSHLISVDEESSVKVWQIHDAELYLEMDFSPETFSITCLMHPSTYLNKILLCGKQGTMQLWNIKTNKLIYTFQGWSEPITAVEQAPAIDVIGVGLQSGKIIIHNLKYDETVMSFQQDWGPVTAIAFRTDGNPIMATASTLGHIALWDLETSQLKGTLRDAHNGSVSGMEFLSSQPLLVTNGPDNALKVWIFDQTDGGGRLLRSRAGHSAPPARIRFFGHKGGDILSAGLDRSFRRISTVKDARSCELSQGSLAKKSKTTGIKVEDLKLPPIIDFAAETSRQSDWDNIVTCHHGNKAARTWRFQTKCIGSHLLKTKNNDEDKGNVTSVALSSCGNFAIIGDSIGCVDAFNIQSGIHRGSFGSPKAHTKAVRGVAIDGINQQLITVSADCTIKFWHFMKRKLLDTMLWDCPITQIELHRESSLLAVGCDDFSVHVVDIETRRIVRTFTGHTNRITDLGFSPDARWLVTSSMDCSVRTWDLPAARLLDCFLVSSPTTSLTLSPTGEFLATSHVDDLGIFLWSNKTLYGHVSLVPLPPDYQPTIVDLPTSTAEQQEDDENRGIEEAVDENMPVETHSQEETFKSPDQISSELITLSLLPQSRWKNLTNLEIIKERNKPKQPPKKPKAAPFFLTTEAGLVPKFVATEEENGEEQVTSSRLIQLKKLQPQSEFQRTLVACTSLKDYDPLMSRLKEMGPSAIDMELRLLDPDAGGGILLMKQFMEFLMAQIATKKDFELAEAYMALFLKIHGSTIVSNPELLHTASELHALHTKTWTNLEELINRGLCLVGYFKSALI